MIVFKAFLHVLNKNKSPIILFTVILVIFGTLNFNNSDSSIDFTSSKPDIVIINNDENLGITKELIGYIEKKSNVMNISNSELDDALFYRNVNYIIFIPRGFRKDVLNGVKPNIEIKSTGDYQASLANMMVNRFMSVLNVYSYYVSDEEKLINLINDTLSKEIMPEVTSKLDSYSLSKMTTYFNFMNYSMLAGLVYVICLILNSFKKDVIMRRIVVSSMSYKKFNKYLLFSNLMLAFILWVIYIILSYFLIGDILVSLHGLVYIINSLVFLFVSLVIALIVGNLINNKNAVNGVVNVIALGSSFLCGAFVPVEFMPSSVVNMGKILPSYYYINNNELIKTMENINLNSLMPVIKNSVIMILFIIVFVILINVVSKNKRKFS